MADEIAPRRGPEKILLDTQAGHRGWISIECLVTVPLSMVRKRLEEEYSLSDNEREDIMVDLWNQLQPAD